MGNIKKGKTEQQDISYFLRKLYEFIKTHGKHKIHFVKLKSNEYGFYYVEAEEIEIDYRKDILPTLIHEVLHYVYPDWCETKIEKEEKWVINHLTSRQVRNILKVLGQNL